MNLWLLTFMFTFAFTRPTSTLPLACSYNGTSHHEGDIVRTEEPCLSCVCRKGTLACSLRVCADAPDNLPPGCFVVHRPNDCCPQIFCEEGFSQNGFELRTAFKMADKLTGNNCRINGSVYAEGSAIASKRTCEYCYCIQGETKCVRPRCYRPFDSCKATYQQSSCCPTHYDCRDVDVDILNAGIKNFEKIYSEVPNSSLRSLSNLENETKQNSEESKTTITEEEKTTEESSTVETSTEVTTTETETPTTTAEEFFSFQTMKPENLVKESTLALMEETTPEPETFENKDVEIRSKLDSDDVISTNSSQDGDDYDAYDYSEPKLPPSLPNLVIFPFVAADAVVKDKNLEPSDSSDIKRIDMHPVFYKDYFTPPVKTEGGFVPKEPSPSDLAFYEYPYIRKGQVELLKQDQEPKPETEDFQSVFDDNIRPHVTHFQISIENTSSSRTEPNSSTADVTPGPFDGMLTESVGKDERPKKPVTVAYKNVVVDYYPDQLITTRGRYKSTTEMFMSNESIADNPRLDVTQTTIVVPVEDTFFGFPEKTEHSTTSESFFDEFLKSLLSEHTTTAAPTTKRKYSSKIKTSTEKPKQEDVTEKIQKPIKKEGVKRHTTPTSTATKEREEETTESRQENVEGAIGSQSERGGSVGALLKLAGCNIYGRMYRVGKVIIELSGPCLECVCTDWGVQCRALDC